MGMFIILIVLVILQVQAHVKTINQPVHFKYM